MNDDAQPQAAAGAACDPLHLLATWVEDARQASAAAPAAMTLATASAAGRPSARAVSLKRLEPDGLVFTTGLWTRKARELQVNPQAAAVFHWPTLGRQARVEGRAEIAERQLAEELFAMRPRDHRLQTLASRQGEPIDGVESLRRRLDALRSETAEQPIACPEDWGAVRLVPDAIELWTEASDRLHDRLAYTATADGWRCTRLAP